MNLLEFMDEAELNDMMRADESAAPIENAINDDEEADEVLSKILWAKDKIEANKKLIEKKKEDIGRMLQDYERRLNGGYENYLDNLNIQLETYLRYKLNNKKGTLKLLHGNVRLKEDPGVTKFDDEAEVLRYLEDNALEEFCVTTKKSIRKTDFKKLFKKDDSGKYFTDNDGNIIHGVHIEKEGLKLSITPAKKEA